MLRASLEPRLSVPDFVSHLGVRQNRSGFCLTPWCETKSGTESLGSRLAQSILPHAGNKGINFRCYEAKKTGESEKIHIQDCEGWWLSGCRSSVAEHWWLKPEVSWVRLPAAAGLFHFPLFSLCILMYQSTVYTPY